MFKCDPFKVQAYFSNLYSELIAGDLELNDEGILPVKNGCVVNSYPRYRQQ